MRVEAPSDVTATANHWWWRPGWRVGRRMYALLLTPDETSPLDALAAQLKPTLTGLPDIEPVAPRGLHLSLTSIGFTDEVDQHQLAAIANTAFRAWGATATRTVTFDRLFIARESLMLTTPDLPWLTDQAHQQRAAVEHHLGPQPYGTFWPHLALGYCTGTADPRDITAAVQPLAAPIPEPLHVPMRLTLTAQHRDHSTYEWTTLRTS